VKSEKPALSFSTSSKQASVERVERVKDYRRYDLLNGSCKEDALLQLPEKILLCDLCASVAKFRL